MLPVTNNDWVEGEVYEINSPESLFSKLDNYESPDYQREIHPAMLDSTPELTPRSARTRPDSRPWTIG